MGDEPDAGETPAPDAEEPAPAADEAAEEPARPRTRRPAAA